jgi:hypothetical protein
VSRWLQICHSQPSSEQAKVSDVAGTWPQTHNFYVPQELSLPTPRRSRSRMDDRKLCARSQYLVYRIRQSLNGLWPAFMSLQAYSVHGSDSGGFGSGSSSAWFCTLRAESSESASTVFGQVRHSCFVKVVGPIGCIDRSIVDLALRL